MKAALFAFTRRGCETARRILTALPEAHWQCFTLERLSEPNFGTLTTECYGQAFGASDLLVFVGACGIAVRKIAPYVRDKRTDPAVVCVDEQGTFAISLLSGHIGGANGLTKTIAQAIGAVPVITTATDVNGKFSVDTWATENGCVIDDMKLAKAVSAAILERNVPFFSEIPIVGRLPDGLTPGNTGTLGICVSFQESAPFARTLRLIPRILHLGIGCRKGTPKETIAQAVDRVFRENHLDFRAVCLAASIDLKQEEPGLLAFCRERELPVKFYSAAQLSAVPGEFTPSPFVRSVTGVDNVCERAALLGAERLLVKKTADCGVTVAVAVKHWEVHFG